MAKYQLFCICQIIIIIAIISQQSSAQVIKKTSVPKKTSVVPPTVQPQPSNINDPQDPNWNDPQDPQGADSPDRADSSDAPDPLDLQTNIPQGEQQKILVDKMCSYNQTECAYQLKRYKKWSIQDLQWREPWRQQQSLYLHLCTLYPQQCQAPDPPDQQPNNPAGMQLKAHINVLCKNDQQFCYQQRQQFKEYCLIETPWCGRDAQNQELWNLLCPRYPQQCTQTAQIQIWRDYLKGQLQVMKTQIQSICALDQQLCQNIKAQQQLTCKQQQNMCDKDQLIQDQYLEYCAKYNKMCSKDIIVLADQNYLNAKYIASLN